jgi:hypothetical protein
MYEDKECFMYEYVLKSEFLSCHFTNTLIFTVQV